jgi:hypothetical protein|uniref:Dit-like phage tail protein N-terminal domain-containing protein n=1 Tax=Myoviridae sp. ctsip2 TaxID=2826705 RepID=A0A8S5N5J7_9CAUD|nr:MAG TPA: hypothetical protein [Myoviridae sp. ctsip2]
MATGELLSDFIYQMDTQYSKLSKSEFAQSLFKKSVNVGEAVVNILGNFGIAGFRFHVPISEQVTMQNDITDYYVETNSAVQDHIARKPTVITLTGLVGEYFYSVNEIEDMLALVTPTLSLVKQFLPRLTPATQQNKTKKALNEQAKVEQGELIVGGVEVEKRQFNGMDLFKLFQDLYKLKSAQTRAYYFFEALFKSRSILSIETSWQRLDNVIIQNMHAIRDSNADITDFTLTFKQISIAESVSENAANAAGRLAQQQAAVTNKGVDKGEEVNTV